MKKFNLIATAAAFLLASAAAYAVDVNNSFNVTIGFTGACSVKTGASDLSFTYAAFDVAQSGSTSTVFQCSRGLTPTFKFDDTAADQTASAAAGVGTGISAQGVIQGVRYTLSGSSAKSTAGTAAAAGAGGVGGTNGSADEYTVSITANVPAGQAGDGTGGSATQVRVLTISY